jgi:proteasome accessory factor B
VLLRERARSVEPGGAAGEGWDVVRVLVRDVTELARELAGHGADVVVLEPADLRDAVVRVLTGALAAAAGPALVAQEQA